MDSKKEKQNSFNWNLKLVEWIARFTIGAPIGLNKSIYSSLPIFLIVLFLGCFIFFANLLINGPRGINISNFEWMKETQKFESSFLYFKMYPDAILQFVMDFTNTCFFLAIPLIHIVFLITILWSHKWKDLVFKLKLIQQEMKLSDKFHKKCRQCSIVALLIGILVQNTLTLNIF